MSSSLDDLEPYEFFQQELDEKLKAFAKSKKLSTSERFILNSFIEYVCFIQPLSSFERLDSEVIEETFPNYLQSLFPDIYNKNEIKAIILSFLN